jgi:hypothetical protein
MAIEKVVKLKVENGEALLNVEELNKALSDTNKAADATNETLKQGTEALDKYTGGMVSAFKAVQGGLKNAIASLKTLKGAVAATGIGLLVVAAASLFSYFTKTERGAQQLRVVMGALGAVVDKLIDSVIALGEGIFNAIQNPKQALIDFGNLLKEQLTNRITGLIELLPALSKAIGQVLKGDFSEAAKTAANAAGKVGLGVENITEKVQAGIEGFKEYAKEVGNVADQAARIQKQLNAVKVAERELVVERAKANKEIKAAQLVAEDINRTTEERIEAVRRVGALEDQILAKELKTAKARASALKAQAALSESSEETLEGIANAEAEVARLEEASLGRKVELQGRIKAINGEAEAAAAALAALFEEQRKADEEYQRVIDEGQKMRIQRLKEEAAAQQALVANFRTLLGALQAERQTDAQKEIAAVDLKYQNLLTAAIKAGQADLAFVRSLEQQKEDEKKKIRDAAERKRKQDQALALSQDLQMASQAVGAIAALQEALTKDNKKNAEKNFKINKALRIGEGIMNTAAAVLQALGTLPPPASFVAAGIAAVAGAAQVATIAKTKFQAEGGTSSVSRPNIPSAPTPSAQPMTPNIRFQSVDNQLAGIAGQPMRAYVVNQDITNANQLERRIRSSATIGG